MRIIKHIWRHLLFSKYVWLLTSFRLLIPSSKQVDRSHLNVLSYWTIKGGGNMGNEFQSLAVKRFLADQLGSSVRFTPWNFLSIQYSWKKKLVVMNGWFGFPNFSFPPSRSVEPIYIGFHNDNSKFILDQKGINHLKRYQPIGCRDTHTMVEFQKIGIESYVSYCPTLLIERKSEGNSEEVCIVDGHSHIGHLPNVKLLLASILEKLNNTNEVVYLSQNFPNKFLRSRESAFEEAEIQLEKILSSKLVITNRLHVALPCLANAVPCVLLFDNPELDSRIATYIPYLWVLTPTWTNLPDDWDWLNPVAARVPDEIIEKLRENLIAHFHQSVS